MILLLGRWKLDVGCWMFKEGINGALDHPGGRFVAYRGVTIMKSGEDLTRAGVSHLHVESDHVEGEVPVPFIVISDNDPGVCRGHGQWAAGGLVTEALEFLHDEQVNAAAISEPVFDVNFFELGQ